eukprot:1183693-Prorocentrum_minimum.AAC.1
MTEDQQREHAEKRKKHMAMLPAIELAVRSGFEAEEHALDVLKVKKQHVKPLVSPSTTGEFDSPPNYLHQIYTDRIGKGPKGSAVEGSGELDTG